MAEGRNGGAPVRSGYDLASRALRCQEDRQMPLTPQDTQTTVQDEILERVEDALDTLTYYVRRKPYATAAVALGVGLLAALAVIRRL
jgi:ElaB/YqjD/DUF883 family membrane-anchored ribosome-binding protein